MLREVTGREARDFILFHGLCHRVGTQLIFAKEIDDWDRHQNKDWWEGGSGRGSSKQPGNQEDRAARRHPSWTGGRGP